MCCKPKLQGRGTVKSLLIVTDKSLNCFLKTEMTDALTTLCGSDIVFVAVYKSQHLRCP